MSIRPDTWIRKMALEHGMIEPFVDSQMRDGVISFGVSSYGYDVRVADEFKVFTNVYNTVVDPKDFDPKSFVDITADVCIIPPNSFALARTIEYFRIPRDTLTVCLGKSTYARCGIIVNVTPFEPEWEGHVTHRDLEHDAACRPRFTPTRASPRSCFSRATIPVRCRTATRRGSIRPSGGSRSRRSSPAEGAGSPAQRPIA